MKKKIIILSLSVGEGHNQVSRALFEEFIDRGFRVEIVDLFQFMDKTHVHILKKLYFKMIKQYPFIWEIIFKMTNNQLIQKFGAPLGRKLWKYFFQYCQKKEIDFFITTHPLATFVVRDMKRVCNKNIQLYAVLSDFSTHELSISPFVDGLFVATKGERDKLLAKYPNVPIFSYGIPLRKAWDDVLNKYNLRKKLQLPLFQRIIVLTGGGEGILPYDNIVDILEKDKKESYIIIFLGRNDKNKRTEYFLKNGSFVRFIPFSNDYYQFVMASDLLISKPGGVTLAEAIRIGIPTVVCAPLPGQEKNNESYVINNYYAFQTIDDSFVASEFISKYRDKKRGEESQGMREARKNIVEKIIELSGLTLVAEGRRNFSEPGHSERIQLKKEQSSS